MAYWLALGLLGGMLQVSSALGQGVALRAVSPINESMAGVATACPIDAAGALHWNPASISGLASSEMSFGMELILPSSEVSSRLPLGPGLVLSGSDASESGVSPVPSMAFVRQVEGTPWSYGLGIYGVAGSRINYPASHTNPILMPQAPPGEVGGLGRLSANVEVVQMAPTVAYALNEEWSVGFAPTITIGQLIASPLFLAGKNADGEYPTGVGTRYVWGGGFQVGAYYTNQCGWHWGASVKSPQWVEPFRYKSEDADGYARDITFDLDYPLIASMGLAYSGFERWIIACDVRYFDYANTVGFKDLGVGPDGALLGLDWNNIMSFAVGVQRQVNDRLYVRAGYCFNENPVDSEASQFNVAAPLIVKHSLHMGASYMFADNWMFNLAYVHCFENSVSGPLHSALGPIPGSNVTSTTSADVVAAGVTKRF